MATAKEELRERVFAGAEVRWGELTENIRERLDFELGVTETLGQTEYILMAAHVAAAIHAAGGRIAPGCGACTASAMLHALNVTNLDPLQHDLLFTLFMCPGRKRKMSVLLDTDAKGEVAAHAYLKDTYGEIEVMPYQPDAPHLLKVNGWEIGITHSPAVDRLSEMLDAISTTTDQK